VQQRAAGREKTLSGEIAGLQERLRVAETTIAAQRKQEETLRLQAEQQASEIAALTARLAREESVRESLKQDVVAAVRD
ncbi:hypothetical protein, partial [Streptococcus pneumoniae]|uniref:hypothetical protein n=1 Tax=Streptococcus pneumoniae TaxID=1313 RepID=UPI001E29B370